MAMLFDIVNPAPAVADTSRQAFERILPSLTEREIETFLLLCDYLRDTGFEDATGGELAEWSGRSVLTIRPRLTSLSEGTLRTKGKRWIETLAYRPSRAKGELSCHPYRPVVPRSAIERLREEFSVKSLKTKQETKEMAQKQTEKNSHELAVR
jgi:hypothetical protein